MEIYVLSCPESEPLAKPWSLPVLRGSGGHLVDPASVREGQSHWRTASKALELMLTADTNLFIHSDDPDSPNHVKAREFFTGLESTGEEFVVCKLVLVQL
ncbi:MAG: hypothetical protein ACRCXD_15065 [Luteolibacter sp.]